MYQDYLQHYGVKGMRWGVRKEYEPHPREKSSKKHISDKQKKRLKKAAIGTGIAVASVLAIYGGYKYTQIKGITPSTNVQNVINRTSKKNYKDVLVEGVSFANKPS